MERTIRPPVFLFDGDCAFCSSTARWLTDHVPTPTSIEPWQQTDLTPLGVPVEEVDAAVVLVSPRLDRSSGPKAIADLLTSSTAPAWRAVGRVLGTAPLVALGWPIYRLIARNRHRMPGGTPQCSLPQSDRDGSAPA